MFFKKHLLNVINFILSGIIFGLGTYALTNEMIFSSNPNDHQNFPFFLLLFLITLSSFLILLFLNLFNGRYKISKIIYISLFILFVIGFITIIRFNSSTNFVFNLKDDETISFVYEYSSLDRIINIFQLLILFLIFITLFDIVPKIFKDFDYTLFASFLCLGIVTILMIISYCIEGINYINFFKYLLSDNKLTNYITHSAFANRNSYGITLFIGICSCLYLHTKFKKFYFLIIAAFIHINIWFTLCKTANILGLILIISYLLMRFFLTLKGNKKRNIISLICISSISIILVSTFLICLGVNNKFETFFYNITGGTKFDSLFSRFAIFKGCISLIKKTSIIFGAGYHNFNAILNNIYGTSFTHNMWLEIFGSGGVILLICSLLFFVYLIILIIKNIKCYIDLSLLSLILVSICLVYTFVESGSIIFPSTPEYLFLSIIIFVPILQKSSSLLLK